MTVCVGDNEVIGCGIAVGKRLEAEGTAEDAFMHIVGGLVGNNRSGIAHCLSVAVGEIRMTDGCLANASDRFFLILKVEKYILKRSRYSNADFFEIQGIAGGNFGIPSAVVEFC